MIGRLLPTWIVECYYARFDAGEITVDELEAAFVEAWEIEQSVAELVVEEG